MDFHTVLKELEKLGKDSIKKRYIGQGAKEPLFGVTTGSMKPLAKQIKRNQLLAEQLFQTGNYDAMYFAGVIAEPEVMTEEDFERWIDASYFYMISDYVVAVTLAESKLGESIANKWIESEEELKISAGFSCYCWMLGNRKDEAFNMKEIDRLMQHVKKHIHSSPKRAKIAMNLFITTVGVSYIPLHEKALLIAKEIGPVEVESKGKIAYLNAYEEIMKQAEKGRIGFKRKYVRC